ncbi:hypothetical protein LVY75_05740 (plasmid) [Sinorhizobium sp. B11]
MEAKDRPDLSSERAVSKKSPARTAAQSMRKTPALKYPAPRSRPSSRSPLSDLVGEGNDVVINGTDGLAVEIDIEEWIDIADGQYIRIEVKNPLQVLVHQLVEIEARKRRLVPAACRLGRIGGKSEVDDVDIDSVGHVEGCNASLLVLGQIDADDHQFDIVLLTVAYD